MVGENRIWKDIEGYEGLYKVSNYGEIYSLPRDVFSNGKRHYRTPGRIMSLNNKIKNYPAVVLYKNGLRKEIAVHRLVALAFIPNPDNKPHIDHIDGSRDNNHISNLRWCTPKENTNNPITLLKLPRGKDNIFYGKSGSQSFVHRAICQYSLDGKLMKRWECMSDAWKALGIDSGCLTKCCQGKRKTAKGFIWKYADNK